MRGGLVYYFFTYKGNRLSNFISNDGELLLSYEEINKIQKDLQLSGLNKKMDYKDKTKRNLF